VGDLLVGSDVGKLDLVGFRVRREVDDREPVETAELGVDLVS
jgi:hypothetical protein